MLKIISVLFLVIYIDFALGRILPGSWSPHRRTIFRKARELRDQKPQWLNKNDNIHRLSASGYHSVLPYNNFDDNRDVDGKYHFHPVSD